MRRAVPYLIFVLFMGTAGVARAHVPNIATFIVKEGADGWRLQVFMSTDGLHQTMKQRHPNEALSTLDPATYRGYVEAALREGIEIRYDGAPVPLTEPRVEVAAHASQATFRLPSPQAELRKVSAHIDALSERGDQNNVFRLVTATINDRVVLKSDNGFRGTLELPEAATTPASVASWLPPRWDLPAGLAAVGLILIALGVGMRRGSIPSWG